MNIENHPCFNVKAHRTFGRIHLPVAPRCNIQCKFCNRKFDCMSESRPGVTSGVLTPMQAIVYLNEVMQQKKNLSVVGIAGPGDPFANPQETLETFRLVREQYPEMLLCVATNGLNIGPYVEDLAKLNVSHVTVTVNAVDPNIGGKVYSWIRYKKRVLPSERGAQLLLENQLAALEALKKKEILVKVNSIILPGINDSHIIDVAKKMSELKIDILNCVPYHPAHGCALEELSEPTEEMTTLVRKQAERYIPQMRHCTRCRADAVGLIGEAADFPLMETLRRYEAQAEVPVSDFALPDRSRVAVASMEGVLVNQHLGEVMNLMIFGKENGKVVYIESRKTPDKGGGTKRWEALSECLSDCHSLMVSGIGDQPKQILSAAGIQIHTIEGLILDAVEALYDNRSIQHLIKRPDTTCGTACQGRGTGCM
jgi:nitrogen fixation protein NifB